MSINDLEEPKKDKGQTTILVVDDEAVTRETLSKLLTKKGYKVYTASGGREALDILMEHDISLMLVDVFMPEMDGYSLLRVFKQASTREIPSIMMSGSEDPETVTKSLQVGAEDFLQKPIKEEILNQRIQKILGYRERKKRAKFLDALMKEEESRKEALTKKLEKVTSLRKKISENIETPLVSIMNTISGMMTGKYKKEEYRLALMSILKTLGSSDLYKPAFVNYMKSTEMDEDTRQWLTSQFTREELPTEIRRPSVSLTRNKKEEKVEYIVETLPFDLDSFEPPHDLTRTDFDTLLYDQETLKKCVMCMFRDLNLFETFKVKPIRLWNILTKLQHTYRPNPYHNFLHAIDVTQYTYTLICHEDVANMLMPFDKFTLLVSAMFHDVDHPGVNNNFMVADHTELAYTYNDISVLENHHSYLTFDILRTEPYNILEGLTDEQYLIFRKNAIKLILGTDMAEHFTIISKFQSRISTGPLTMNNPDDRFYLMVMILKLADISNIARPFKIAQKWAIRCVTEFFNQGDKERERGLPVSPQNDRYSVNLPKSQISFGDFVVGTLVKQLVIAIPSLKIVSDSITENRKNWQRVAEEEAQKKVSSTKNNYFIYGGIILAILVIIIAILFKVMGF